MGKIIGVALVVALLIGGWFFWKGTKMAEAPGEKVMETPTVAQKNDTTQLETKGMVASIKDAMGLGKKMQCTFTTETDGKAFQSTVMVDGSTFKTMSNMGDVTVYGLFDGADQYTWMSNSKEGYKMSKACMEELKNLAPTEGTVAQAKPKDLQQEFDSAQNVNCVPATAVDFDLPKEVTFADQCAMMKQSFEMMNQFKDKLPAGVQIPGMPSGN